MWQSNTTFTGNYSYDANAADAAVDTTGQSGNKLFIAVALFAILGLLCFLLTNHTSAPAAVPTVEKKDVASEKPPAESAQPKKEVVAKPEAKEPKKPAPTTTAQALIESPAPAKPSELTYDDVVRFIRLWKSIAQQEQSRTGVPASISLAQAIVESRCGTSKLATQNNNYFGIKCFSRNCKEGHCTNRKDDTHKDFFRKFTKKRDSWTAHSNFLCQSRYKPLHGRTWRGWCNGLQEKGYATDKNYAKSLTAIIEKYKLYQYDKQ